MMRGRAVMLGAAVLAFSGGAMAGDRLAQMRERGFLTCGVEADRPGFAVRADGVWSGLDVDVCRAVAAVVFGDAAAADIIELDPAERFTHLQRGEIDLLARNTVWTLGRDAELGLTVPAPAFVDRPALVSAAAQAVDVDGQTVCLAGAGWPSDRLLVLWAADGWTVSALQEETPESALAGLADGECGVAALPASAVAGLSDGLGAFHVTYLDAPVWPLGPAIRQDDPELADIVRWTLHALVAAETLNVGQSEATAAAADTASATAGLEALLTAGRPTGVMLGVGETWATDALAAVGHYGEIYDRHFGAGVAQPVPRGPNAAADLGGLLLVPGFY